MSRSLSIRIAMGTAAVVLVCAGAAQAAGTGTGGPAPAAGSAPAAAAARPVHPAAQAPTKKEIAALFDQWNAALATGDPAKVADRYAPGAVLLPTVSAQIRTNRAGIIDYFEHFLQKKPQGEIQQRVITVLDRTTAVDTGRYRFTLTGKDGVTSKVDARYTFVYELRGGKWLIVNHHSSVLPTEG